MFKNSIPDDDIDLDLDDIVTFKNTTNNDLHVSKVVTSASCVAELNQSNISRSKKSSPPPLSSTQTSQADEWGSDDDSHFLDIIEPEAPRIEHHPNQLNASVCPSQLDLPKENLQPIKPKFPGPAGMLLPALSNADSPKPRRGKQQRQRVNFNHINMDGLISWDQALFELGLSGQLWKSKKMNLQMVKETFAPNVVYLTAPLLVVGVQKIDYAPVIRHDVDCVLQDPTGEVKGRILQQVVVEHGKLIQVGAILVLRRASVLQFSSDCLATVSKNCLVAIYSPKNSHQIMQCRRYEKTDLMSWLSEPIVRGNPVRSEDDEAELQSAAPPTRLFSSTVDAQASKTNSSYSRLLDHPPVKSASPSNHANNRPANQRPPTYSASPTMQRPTPVPPPPQTRQFQPKAPSAIVTPSRPAPYAAPNRVQSSSTSTSTASDPSKGAQDQFLAQFLDGVDTDALFADDF